MVKQAVMMGGYLDHRGLVKKWYRDCWGREDAHEECVRMLNKSFVYDGTPHGVRGQVLGSQFASGGSQN